MDPTVRRPRGVAAVVAAALVLAGALTVLGGPLAAAAGMVVFVACQRHALVGAEPFRAADAVTLGRTVLLGLFAAELTDSLLGDGASAGAALSWATVALAVVVLLLDGVDGAVARAFGGGTDAGRSYDDVVDAVVLLVLAGAAGWMVVWWAVVPGLVKPLFALGQRLRPRWRHRLGPSTRRRVLGSVPAVLLLAVMAPLPWTSGGQESPGAAGGQLAAAALAVLLIAGSFARDIVDLERGDPRRGRG